MAYQQNVQTKMSFSIEELSKSSRDLDPVRTDAVVNHIHDIYLPNSSQSCTTDMILPLTISTQRPQSKRKRQDDSLHSDDNNFSSTNSGSRNCASPGSSSDDSANSDQPTKRARTTFTNAQLMVLEQCYSYSKYLQIEDRPVLAKKLKLSQHKIKWWFQNRRMKEKRHIKSTSCNSSPELSQFVGVGKPGSRILTMESKSNISQQSRSSFPMFSPYMCGMSPFVYPGYSSQIYSSVSPQTMQHYRT
ncbi:HOX_3 [Mytilus coruscus]|uniref:HOX_3 n=1 Tax=Mytilus coruscus TaxID=42192 RepID=A0A6J8C8S9_MYTCO|nr:HOX_3 [Mytilus coruscus]